MLHYAVEYAQNLIREGESEDNAARTAADCYARFGLELDAIRRQMEEEKLFEWLAVLDDVLGVRFP